MIYSEPSVEFDSYFHIPLPIVKKHELGLPFPPRNRPIKFRYTKLDIERKPICFGSKVKDQGHESQKHCHRGSMHSCECWLLLVIIERPALWRNEMWRVITASNNQLVSRSAKMQNCPNVRQRSTLQNITNSPLSLHDMYYLLMAAYELMLCRPTTVFLRFR